MPDIIFMGTPEFAVPAMKSLLAAGNRILLLVCQPDKKKGRGHKLQFPPTKQFALENEIPVFQPEGLKSVDVIETLTSLNPDFFVVIAYGKILPEAVLRIPVRGCINVHASMLPKWRGAAPIQFSLLEGDEETGVCTMLMDQGMDTGDILLDRVTKIGSDERVDSLTRRLSQMGAELIVETIQAFDQITPREQHHDAATYTRLLTKEDRILDWNQEGANLYGRFRALTPQPGVVTYFRGKRLIIKSMALVEETGGKPSGPPGTINITSNGNLLVSCANGRVAILECQPENKKAVSALDFINGYQIKTGEILGEINQP